MPGERAASRSPTSTKILLHQANAKMDEAIVKRLLRGRGVERSVEELVPMTVSWLGNSSVATLPTLLDLLTRGSSRVTPATPATSWSRLGRRRHERQRPRLPHGVTQRRRRRRGERPR